MNDQATTAESFKNKRFRSPPYPALPLGKAIERAKELHSKALHHTVPLHVLATAWGFTTKSSSITTVAAALKQYGLLDDEGSGDKRRFRLTDDAVRIVTDPVPNSAKRVEAIKRAALAPKVHAELWGQFGLAGLSGSMDATLQAYLTLDRKDAGDAPYSSAAAQDIINIYGETIRFAGLAEPDIISGLGSSETDSGNLKTPAKPDNKKFGGAKVGDLVQWEAGGELKLEAAKRVRAIQKHDGVEWVFVDGSETGIPMSETIIDKKGDQPSTGLVPPRLAIEDERKPGLWKEVTDLDEGNVTLTLPEDISPESYQDLKTWMELILRKAKRRAGVTDN